MSISEALAWLRQEIEGDLARARHILDVRGARPDPRREMHDAIADCEAKLAMLDFCIKFAGADEWAAGQMLAFLASGYKHRPGYPEHWESNG